MSPSRHQIGLFPENPEADGCDMFLGWVLCKHHVGRPESETAGTGPAPPHPARTATSHQAACLTTCARQLPEPSPGQVLCSAVTLLWCDWLLLENSPICGQLSHFRL